jgi:hypothetical protein
VLDFPNRFLRDPHHQNQADKPAKDFEVCVGWHGIDSHEAHAVSQSCSQITNETYQWINHMLVKVFD